MQELLSNSGGISRVSHTFFGLFKTLAMTTQILNKICFEIKRKLTPQTGKQEPGLISNLK